jgi:hypothetical protein
VLASEGRRLTRNRRVAVRHVATRRSLGVLRCKQPRAVGAGKRGLGRPARHNASAATGAARGCPVRLATDSDRQSGRAGYRLEGRGGRRTVMRVVPVPSPGHLDGGCLPGPSSRPALPCDGLLARSVSPVFAPGLLTGWPDPALLTTSLSLAGACNDNDRTVLQARSSARGARPGRLVWRRRRRHSGSREAYARRILTIGLVGCVGGTGPVRGSSALLTCLPGEEPEKTPR